MAKDHYPPMHSVEHLLNQTMVRLFDCGRSVNAHIEKKKSRIDYSYNRNLTNDEITMVEERVNTLIGANLYITEEFLPRNEAEKRFHLNKLPDTAGDQIRIVKIGDYDACPCIGSHVPSTAEIGKFKILSTSFESGILRLRIKIE